MTNTETFIGVILISVMVVGPFAAMVVALLRHSKNERSTEPQFFKTSFKSYFSNLDILFAIYLAGMMLALFKVLFFGKNGILISDWTSGIIIFCVFLLFASLSVYTLSMAVNHWKYTKGVTVIWYPLNKLICIDTPQNSYELYEEDIEHVTIFTNNNYKLPFDYYRFTIKGKGELLLTSRTKGVSKIFHNFLKMPTETQKRLFPLIG